MVGNLKRLRNYIDKLWERMWIEFSNKFGIKQNFRS
jgi:hypothetical protein